MKLPRGADLNDLQNIAGPSAVDAKIRAAFESFGVLPDGVRLIPVEEVTLEPVRWLWKGWLARGELHLLAGPPGTGKSTIAVAVAATISAGGRWPDGERAEPGEVLYYSAEDTLATVLRPRLEAAGANLRRVLSIGETSDASGARPFDPACDLPKLQRAIEARPRPPALIVIDPVVMAVAGDSHKNAEVRRGLQPLVELARSTGAACLGITHLSKASQGREPLERLIGSVAFGALARIVWIAARRTEEGEGPRRVLVLAKNNLAPDSGGFGFDLSPRGLSGGIEAVTIEWCGRLEGAARYILADVEDSEPRAARLREAKEFLMTELADGPKPAKEIEREAKRQGLSMETVRDAKRALGIEAVKDGFQGKWVWKLPQRWPNFPKDGQDGQE